MVALPRLLIAAPATGQGKTTIATGLMAALRASGLTVSGHKVGPDYIDPGYHSLATGRPGRNLDPHLVGESRIAPLLVHGAAGADVAVIEGVMGLYDGRLGTDGFASTAHVAALTSTPVVLVLDVARQSRTIAAVAAGMAAFDARISIAGVILNRAAAGRNVEEITRALDQVGLPVFGALPRDERLAAPSRHLGLVPAAERAESIEMVARLGSQVRSHLDVAALLDVARSAPEIGCPPWDPATEVRASGFGRPVVAVAAGRAFTFRYAETEELLRAAGCEVVEFDPLRDSTLPSGTAGIYLGGGFPEMYAAELGANRPLLEALRSAVSAGVPTVAECAGLLYLAKALDGVPMAGALPVDAAMSERLTLRYPVATGVADTLLTRVGESATGHEFHRTTTTPASGRVAAWEIDGAPTGFASASLHASYLHVHWAGHPHLAQRFADAVQAWAASDSVSAPFDPLQHHGDAEVGLGLLDFAVNVYPGDRPEWLDRALHDAVGASGAYPEGSLARDAIARQHNRPSAEVLVTSGAAEAFTLIAGARPWAHPVVVHPQFTEPHAALVRAGLVVDSLICDAATGFSFDPATVPTEADLVILGNPTNPTGVLHPAETIRAICRPGRVVVVDEAFMDVVPGQAQSLAGEAVDGLVVVRSLTKHWSIPGIRVGYLVGDPSVVAELAGLQTPWSVSTPALAAARVCADPAARPEATRRANEIVRWRGALEVGLHDRGIEFVPSAASFVLARLGPGVRERLRDMGIAIRRGDTFPGLGEDWARIAVRPEPLTAVLLEALDQLRLPLPQ